MFIFLFLFFLGSGAKVKVNNIHDHAPFLIFLIFMFCLNLTRGNNFMWIVTNGSSFICHALFVILLVLFQEKVVHIGHLNFGDKIEWL